MLSNSKLSTQITKRGQVRWFLVVSVLVVSTSICMAALYNRNAQGEWEALPAARTDDVDSVAARLSEIESFNQRYPVWLGLRKAQTEHSFLRTRLEVLKTEAVLAAAQSQEQSDSRQHEAELARQRGLQFAQSGDFRGALDEFRIALYSSESDWEERDRITRDVNAIETWLEEEK